ncbi:MAG: hypothetical protein M5U12_18100 [Verrucomicrobia bacterium]|nr:hypothetical protein [Verrucomicrobiota bacterium]
MTHTTPSAGKRHPLARLLPASVRQWYRRVVNLTEWEIARRRRRDPYADEPPDYVAPGSRFTLGILREFMHYHKWYVAACRELGVSYRLLDLSANDWNERIHQSACDAFLAWPSVGRRAWRELFDDRLRLMEFELGLYVYPSYRETWLYENKRRTRDWLLTKALPHPRTWIFYERRPALEFVANTELPIVAKTCLGAAHSGVWIIRDRAELRRLVLRALNRGLLARGRHQSEAEAGSIILQQYLPDVREWRLVRIGDSYFGHPKGRVGDFHSGSGKVEWDPPEPRHLDFLKYVTDLGGFTSMDVDVFETRDGLLLVNELQTVFGAGFSVDQTRINGEAGRFARDPDKGGWCFQAGDYARNACANARVLHVVAELSRRCGL